MTPNKQKLIERLLNGNDDLFTSFVIAGLEENLEIIYDEVKKILSMDRIPDYRMDDLMALRADGEATIRILQHYGAGDYPFAAELMAKAHVRIREWECYLRATEQPDMSQEDNTDVQPIPALKDAQERTKGMLTEADHDEPTLGLDIDEYGIWLIEEALHGEEVVTTKQLGHVAWKQVAIYVQKPLAELTGVKDDAEMSKHFVEMADRIEELEAKLAKAVEHFKKLRRRQDCLETFDLVVHEITETALAELTGGSADENSKTC
jgi:hypothetical protein